MGCVIKKNRQWTEYINNFNSEMYLTLWKRKQLNEICDKHTRVLVKRLTKTGR